MTMQIKVPIEVKMSMDEIIDRLKKDDFVHVVRCKDCKHHIDEEPGMVYCPNIVGGWLKEEDYCSMGERKNNG